jgi:hypothetical protein
MHSTFSVIVPATFSRLSQSRGDSHLGRLFQTGKWIYNKIGVYIAAHAEPEGKPHFI